MPAREARIGSGSSVGGDPISLLVQTPRGSTIAQLVTGPGCTGLGVKTQLAGMEGTPIDNQTLLLGGRVLHDHESLSASGVLGAASLTLVRCVPLLAGRLSKLDLQRLTSDDKALSRSIDAFKEDPRYDAAEIEEIMSAAVAAVLPSEPGLVEDILQSLPLRLLPPSPEAARAAARRGDEETEGNAAAAGPCMSAMEPCAEPTPRLLQPVSPSLQHFNISEDFECPLSPPARKPQRERFTSCVHAGLQVILLALEQQQQSGQ